MNMKLTTKDIYKTIFKNCLFVIFFTVIFGIFGYFYAQHKQTTVYKSTQNLIINHSYRGESANDELQADMNLGKTYEKAIESNDVIKQSKKYLPNKLQKKYSESDIAGMTHAHAIPGTTMIEISSTTSSASNSVRLTNAFARAAIKEVPKKIPSGSVKSVAKSTKNDTESSTTPSRKKYTALGLAVGFLLGMVIAFSITTWTKLI